MKRIQIPYRGLELLHRPLFNKGTAFTQEERDELGLNGLLPPQISSVEEQIQRSYLNFSKKRTPLEKYESLVALMSRNELLFYQLISRFAAEMLPIIYTPTVGDAAMEYSRIFFHQRGLYLSYPIKDKIEKVIMDYPLSDIEVIVVTDGERILGLGDQGIGGMTIPIGKLSLYTLFAGVHPAKTLPIILDVGTNNPKLLNDPLYLGYRHQRLTGAQYDEFVDRFIQAIKKRYPNVLLQWEDLGRDNARRMLDHYRDQILSFNDDIQGTAAVTVGALLAASKLTKTSLKEQNVAIFGAGSAGTGIADMIVQAMRKEGLAAELAQRKIYLIDIDGLIHFSSKQIYDSQKPYVQPQATLKDWKLSGEHISLLDVVKNAKPNILIGVSAQGGAFTKEVIETMKQYAKQPIIFPLSNPTSKAECTPEEAIQWTKGKAIIATGSPFPNVRFDEKEHSIGQCNNVYIFPGLGLGAIAVQATKITDGMLIAAAQKLAEMSPALKREEASLFPPVEEVKNVSLQIARAVAEQAIQEGVARSTDIEKGIQAHVWEPSYPHYYL